jgi:hypothetical protein
MPRLNLADLPPHLQAQVSRQLHKAGEAPPIQTAKTKKTNDPKKDCQLFTQYCKSHGLPAPVAEYKFHDLRRWRFDYAWPDSKIALEVEGGIWTGGRHTRGKGFIADLEKYNTASSIGWRIFRITPSQLYTQKTATYLQLAFIQ